MNTTFDLVIGFYSRSFDVKRPFFHFTGVVVLDLVGNNNHQLDIQDQK